MKYDPQKHHRRSIRLKGYDYSQVGMYFITTCTQHREHFFGHIENEEMILNDAGRMIDKWWQKIPEKFKDIELDVYQIMPNHFHAIVINTGSIQNQDDVLADSDSPVRAHPRVSPTPILDESSHILGEHDPILGEHMGSPLHTVMQWFKTMSTNEYIRGVKTLGWQPFDKKMWQRDYYEHIIRNQQSYENIANYIINNPHNWQEDRFFR